MVKIISKDFNHQQTNNKKKKISIALHSLMLTLCFIGSIIFLLDLVQSSSISISQYFEQFSLWKLQKLTSWSSWLFNFIKIKVIIPGFIISYFYFCVTRKIFQKLFKEDYSQKYADRYSKVYKMQVSEDKKQMKLLQTKKQQQDKDSKNEISISKDMFSKQGYSSFNLSRSMVKSMNKSLIGSIKSFPSNNLLESVNDQSINTRSSKIIQSLSKKIIEVPTGKQLHTLFQKCSKNLSQSFLSVSSSGLEGDDLKIRIKNKKYYDFINQKQAVQFRKWFEQTNQKYLQQLKSQNKDIRNHYTDLVQLKKGLEKELTNFLKEYNENKQVLKECLIRYWTIKIQSFEPQQSARLANKLSNLFQQGKSSHLKIQSNQNRKNKLINQNDLFKSCSSPRQYLRHLNQIKISIRNAYEKQYAQKQLISILERRSYLNTLLNISTIEGSIFSPFQSQKIKLIQQSIDLLCHNKIDIFFQHRNEGQTSELDLLEQNDLQSIKQMVKLRKVILIYFVNKINLITNQNQFKIKMGQAVTSDSGFLSTILNFFKNKCFAELQCDQSFDYIFHHYNVKIFKKSSAAQQTIKQSIAYCKPGIDNSLFALLVLVKQISQYCNQNYQFKRNFQEERKLQTLKLFISDLHTNRKI